MVHGLEKFKKYFGNYTNQYVFIGGTACDILMDELGSSFRATKDLDIVLIIEDGGYKHREKGLGKNQFYRFSDPSDPSFPKMIELFSKVPNKFELRFNTGVTPIHIDESIVSLSAILLNDVYYDSLIKGKRKLNGYSIIEIETVILFKIKDWLDLRERKVAGEKVDSKNIKKHKNDVFRLLVNVTPSSRVEISEEIQKDLSQFMELIKEDKPDLKNLGIRSTSFYELIELLNSIFIQR